MYGLGSHSIDQTVVLFGRPKSVTGFSEESEGGNVESEIEDTFTIVLQYEGESDCDCENNDDLGVEGKSCRIRWGSPTNFVCRIRSSISLEGRVGLISR